MTRSLISATLLGTGILVGAQILWALVLTSEDYPVVAAWAVKISPAFSAFLVAYLVPRRKIAVGMSMALVSAVLAGVANFLYPMIGLPTDLPGIRGTLTVFVIGLLGGAILCGVGALAGYALSKRTKRGDQ